MGLNFIDFYKNKIKPNWKIAFFSAFVFGLLIHLYKFTNTLPNHDSLYNYYSSQNVVGSGRWLLSIACGFSSYFDLPWITGLFSLIFISMTAVIITELFDMKNPVLIILSSALLSSFPSMTETFFFGFTADGYMLAMFLASLSVLLSRIDNKKVMNYIIAGLCICCTCGIYQAYISFAMVLTLICLVLYLIDNQRELKNILIWVGKQILLYAFSLALYWIVWKVALHFQSTTANSYQGISTMSLNLTTILRALPNSIRNCLLFFFEWNVFEHNWTLYGVLNFCFLITFIITTIIVIIKTKVYKNIGRFILFIMSLGLIPFAACIWCFTSQDVSYRPMMLTSLYILYVYVAVIGENYLHLYLKNAIAVLLCMIIINNGVYANICYYYMNNEYETTYANSVEIMNRIHSLDTSSQKIAIIGNNLNIYQLRESDKNYKVPMLSQLLETNLLYDQEHIIMFINHTYHTKYEGVSNSILIKCICQSKTVQQNNRKLSS